MNELKIFNYEQNEIRTVEKDGETWWVLKDVCEVFGEQNYRRVSTRIDEDEKGVSQIDTLGGKQNMTVVNESGLYSTLFAMQPEKARGVDEEYILNRQDKLKKFKKWVTSDVLPTIRKTGGYVNNEDLFVNTYLSSADEQTKLLFKTTLETVRNLNAKIQQQKPLVEFAETVSKAANSISIGDFAKILNSEHIKLGRNKMFEWFRSNKYLMRNNTPYQKYIDQGYFKVIEQVYTTPYGNETKTKTLVTGKGQIYFVETLRKLF